MRMVTPGELRSVSLFVELEEPDLEWLCRVMADISLGPGEFAAHDGDSPGLFALLDGQGEVVKVVDGEERVIGKREPGHLFGEISIVLGTPQPAGFRAIGRGVRCQARPPRLPRARCQCPRGRLARRGLAADRIGGPKGLQALASSPTPYRAIVLGHRLDAACADIRRFLDRNQIRFRWFQPDIPAEAEEWWGPLPAEGDCPRFASSNGKTVFRPQLRRIAELLEIATEPLDAEYDTVVVGAGPAGLAAAVYGASEGLRTLVIEREAPGGQAGTSSRIENYLGFPSGVSGDDLSKRALSAGAPARRRDPRHPVLSHGSTRVRRTQVHLDGGDVVRARSVILACGVSWRQLEIEGFDRLVGKGIFYGAARSEASNSHGLDIQIIGAGNSAGQAAMFFSTHARSVTILYRGDVAREEHVQLPRRADRQEEEHPHAVPYGGDGRAWHDLTRGDRRPRLGDRRDDPARVRRALHTPPGGTVAIQLSREDGGVACSVSDTGPGIPADQLDSIFDRYARSADSGGSGLGLAIVRSLVEAHGGSIEAENAPGHGATIRLFLPAE